VVGDLAGIFSKYRLILSRKDGAAERGKQQAVADLLRFVKLSMEASTAIDYYSLRENDDEQQVLQLTIRQLQQALVPMSNRLNGGLASDLEVEEAKPSSRALHDFRLRENRGCEGGVSAGHFAQWSGRF